MGKSYNQRNAKVDANQPEIVAALRRMGAKVRPVHQLKGFFDILVGYKGNTFHIEIKNSEDLPKKYFKMSDDEKRAYLEGKLTSDEYKFMKEWESVGVPYYIVSSVEEAINAITK